MLKWKGRALAAPFPKGAPHVGGARALGFAALQMGSGSCPVRVGPAGSAVISSRQAGSFKESFSKA